MYQYHQDKPDKFQSLADVIELYKKDKDSGIYVINGRDSETFVSYENLYSNARKVLFYLQKSGIPPKSELVFQIEDNQTFLSVFWACILGGIIPVPITFAHRTEHRHKLLNIWKCLNNPYLITSKANSKALGDFFHEHHVSTGDKNVFTEDIYTYDKPGETTSASLNDVAFIQFSSGSTGDPKGVVLTHENLLTNIESILNIIDTENPESTLSWMPLTHDMGLIGFHLVPLFNCWNHYLIPSNLFVNDPLIWMDKIHEHRVSMTCSPSFGYKLFLISFMMETSKQLDLSCLRIIFNGAEPISADVCHEFLDKMEGYGLKRNSMLPVYGLAEASLAVTFPPVEECIKSWLLNRHSLKMGEKVKYAEKGDRDSLAFLDLGHAIDHTRIKIMDDTLNPLPEETIGNLYIKGKNVTNGYYNNPDATQKAISVDGWLNTGDAGFIKNGRLTVTGRIKDIIFYKGSNYYSHDLERLAEGLDSVVPGSVVAVGLMSHENHEDDIIIFNRHKGNDLQLFLDRASEIKRHIGVQTGLPVKKVVPVDKIHRTTSGKLQRYKMIEDYLSGKFDPVLDQLKELEAAHHDIDACTGPRNDTERALADIWSGVLSIEPSMISMDADFFELGGDSLSAIRMVSGIQNAFNIPFTIELFFNYPEIRLLSEHIRACAPDKPMWGDGGMHTENEFITITRDLENRYEPFPITQVQQAYWIGRNTFFELGNIAQHVYIELDMDRPDLDRFNGALQKLIHRHDMLRAVMLPHGEQKILDPVVTYHIGITDLVNHDDESRDLILSSIRKSMSHEILPAETFPLFNIKASRLSRGIVRFHFSFDGLFLDGWSMRVCIEELIRLYENPDSELEPLAISFRDYVLALESTRRTVIYKQCEAYWYDRMDSLPPAPELPLAQSTEAIKNPTFTRVSHQLSQSRWLTLKKRASKAGITPTSVLLTAFSQVIALWSKNKRFTLNLTLFNRFPLHPQINDIMGNFTSLTLLEVDCTQENDFISRAKTLLRQLACDLDHRYYSGVDVIRELNRRQKGATGALMPVVVTSMLGYDNADFENTSLPQLGNVVYKITQTPQVWLDHQIFEENGELIFDWDYVKDLFPDRMIQDLFDTYCQYLNHLSEPEVSWRAPVPLNIPERQRVQREEINQTDAPFSDELLHTLFAHQALKQPDHPAIITPHHRMTYKELFDQARRLGTYLKRNGASVNTFIAVAMNKGWEQATAVLGVLFSGAAYLPIDPDLPEERIAYLLETGEVNIVLTQSDVVSKLKWPEHVLTVSIDTFDFSKIERESFKVVQTKEDLAYMIFTSGSTGLPKGVMIDHRGAVNTAIDINRRFGVGPHDRVFALSNLNFDLSVYDIFGTLSAGGTIVMPDAPLVKDPGHWAKMVVEHGVTLWNSVPALMQLLVDYAENDGQSRPDSLRFVLLSGDWIPVSLPGRIRSLVNTVNVISLGGATEASIWSIHYPIESVGENQPSIPYGKPLANQTFYVLDKQYAHCPVWVPGELYIGGIGLAKGYWKDKEKTQAHFVFHPKTGEALYRTGDWGRFLPDGNIEFLGREDLQVKINGYRIELGEIEAALLQHPDISDVVVDTAGEKHKRLLAYVVYGNHDRLTPEPELIAFSEEQKDAVVQTIKTFLMKKLPRYMVPMNYAFMNRMKLTTNGKIDRKALSSFMTDDDGKKAYTAPITDVEKKIAALWEDILGRDSISVMDNFFELGGDSLSAIRMVSGIQKALTIPVTIEMFFNYPEIRLLADHLKTREHGDFALDRGEVPTDNEFITITRDIENRYEPFPLTEVQQAYWIGRDTIFELGNISEHIYIELDMENPDLVRFNDALQTLIRRHDMLRAIILPDGNQIILDPDTTYDIEIFDLEHADAGTRDDKLLSLRQAMSHEVLPAETFPLFNIKASRLPRGIVRLHLSFDGLFLDGWSMYIFVVELIRFYENPEMVLKPLAISFRDYVLALESARRTAIYKRCEAYWFERMDFLPPAPGLPLAQSTETIKNPTFSRLGGRLSQSRWHTIRKRASKAGITPTSVLLTAFAEAVALWSKNKRFTINLTLFNRFPLHPQINDIMGNFTSLNLLEVDCTEESDFISRAKALLRQLVSDLDHRYYSGVDVIRELNRRQKGATSALMPVVVTSMLGYDNADFENTSLPQIGNVVYKITQTPQVWLDHQIFEENGELIFDWDYVKDLFPDRMMEDLFDAYCQYLNHLSQPDVTWRDLAPLTIPEPQRALRDAVNNTHAPLSEEMLHTLFERQAVKQPDAVAVITPHRRMTYNELYIQATRLGIHLRRNGASANTFIAVAMNKGWEQVTAVLGILFSGAAYLPIDPDLPEERVSYLLETGEVNIVLTRSDVLPNHTWPEHAVTIPVDTFDFSRIEPEPSSVVRNTGDLAYMIFTSGSTGLPKGVMIDHRGAVNTIIDINRRFDVGPRDRVFALSNLNFDLSVYDIFGTLAAGGTIVMPDALSVKDPEHWSAMVIEHGVTLWNSVPALMQLLVDHAENNEQHRPASLRCVLMSGDWIPVTLPDRIRALVSTADVISLGGATEASIWSIFHPIETVDVNQPSIPYGKPLANQTFYVLDNHFDHRPVWVPGELYIGGTGLAKGYWKDPEKTHAHFVIHPKTCEPLYRTGDWGRYLPDGNIEFLGREDLQVKINGYRIELGEIEAALLQHPDITEVVVDALGDKHKRLFACVVYGNHDRLTPEPELIAFSEEQKDEVVQSIKAFLMKKLPGHMVPMNYAFMNRMPLTANGKTDRKALSSFMTNDDTETVYVAPETEIEKRIAAIWEDILDRDSVSIHDNFFEIGGNSLQVIALNSKLREAFGRYIHITVMYKYVTIHTFAEYLRNIDTNTPQPFEENTRSGKITKSKKDRTSRREKRRRITHEP